MSGRCSGFAVVYQWRAKPGMEAEFIDAWTRLTREMMRIGQARGSRLHRLDNGNFVAYAQWPDRGAWEKACALDTLEPGLSQRMLDATEDVWPPMLLSTTSDLLLAEGQAPGQADALPH